MKSTKKVFVSCLALGMAAALNASAADNAVLFKVHDIVPVKNADGNIVSCDLGATFYNRTANEIVNSAIDLVWHDEVVSDTIDQEARQAKEAQRLNRGRSISRFNTATYNDKDLMLSLKLPPLKPYQQVTLKSKINTDRCFLLLGDVDVQVSNCGASNEATVRQGTVAPSCENLFVYVSPQNPEYYSEFQAISPEEQKAQETSQLEQQRKDIDAAFDQANQELAKLTATLTGSGSNQDSGKAQ